MKSKCRMIVLATILSCGMALLAQVPQIVTYQGRLQAGGTNFNGTGQFKFAIVNQGTNMARQATATATVVSGFIVGYTVTSGGYGYTTVPAVTITDPTGSSAVGVAQISGGVVTNIYPQNAGSGYSASPTVTIAPPPASMAYVTYWSHDGTSVDGGEPTTAVPVPVNQGLFAVGLGDVTFSNMSTLPASVFANPNPSLRIWFSDGVGSVQQLSPDQAFTAAAYAMMAVTASNVSGTIPSTGLSGTYGKSVSLTNAGNSFSGDGSSLGNLNASALASGTVPGARLSGVYGSAVNFSNGGNSFTGIGSGLTSLNAGSLSSGTVPDARLSGNVALLNSSPTFSGQVGASGFNANSFNGGSFTGNFGGNGNALTGLNASSLSTGTVPDGRLSGNVAFLNSSPIFTGQVTASSFSGIGSGLTTLNAGNLFSGIVPDARLSVNVALLNGPANFIGPVSAASFSGSGSSLTSLNANNLSSGTVLDARLSANVDLLSLPQTFAVTKTFNMAPSFAAGAGAPFTVSSSTLVINLNADMLDGSHGTAFAPASGSANYIQNQNASAQTANFRINGSAVAGSFTGNGGALTNLGASSLNSDSASLAKVSGGSMAASGGDIGIGSPLPAARLDVRDAYGTNDNGTIHVGGSGANADPKLVKFGDDSYVYIGEKDADDRMVLGAHEFVFTNTSGFGAVGIGRVPAANILEVEGSASKSAAGDWLANSDARIKTDIATVTSALDTLGRVRLVSFRYTDDYKAQHPCLEDRRYVNVVAQEFAEVFPDYVKPGGDKLPNGDPILSVDTYPLTIYSAAAIQELNRKLEQQKAENAELKKQLDQLKTLVATLGAKLNGGAR